MNTIKVLIVASANKGQLSPIVLSQALSLPHQEIMVSYFGIHGKGISGYLSNIRKIRKCIRNEDPDIIHAHYSFSGYAARLAAGGKPVVVSLMGSDLANNGIYRFLTSFFCKYLWDRTIVKSEWMAPRTGCRHTVVIPNGVDLNRFVPMDNRLALKKKLGLSPDRKHIFFFADPVRRSKNFELAQKAVKQLSGEDIELVVRHDVPHGDMPELINAADAVLLTSRWEGSPNIVKEAMACNCPVVATNVGDIAWLFGKERGYYLAEPDPADLAHKIRDAINVREKPGVVNGRDRIIELGIDSASISKRIIEEYRGLLDGKNPSAENEAGRI